MVGCLLDHRILNPLPGFPPLPNDIYRPAHRLYIRDKLLQMVQHPFKLFDRNVVPAAWLPILPVFRVIFGA